MIEYCIYQRYYNGEPFIIHTFNDFYSAKAKLLDIIQTDIDRNRIFYVDNDFYNNKYQNNLNCKYYCIMCRNITRWKRLEE